MIAANSHYDYELQMFTNQPRQLNLAYLKFLRWLAEQRLLEHETASEPGGDSVEGLARLAQRETRLELERLLRGSETA